MSLRWSRVDLSRGKIDFRREGTPETKKEKARQRQKRKEACVPYHRVCVLTSSAPRETVTIGHVILWEVEAIEDINTAFNNAAKRVYLSDVSPQTLKHTSAKWLMQLGIDPFKVSDFLATSVPRFLKHYGHHNPDH